MTLKNPNLPDTDHRQLRVETFASHVGTEFSLRNVQDGSGASVEMSLKLVEASPLRLNPADGRALGRSGDVRRDPFSLLFAGPDDKLLQQGTYALDHEAFEGGLTLFLVPIGPGEEGMGYEATFS